MNNDRYIFRAWLKEHKMMVDVDCLYKNGNIKADNEIYKPDEFILMQSTGLRARKLAPKPIYEGDIVELVLPDDGEVRYFEVAIKTVQREVVCHSDFTDSTKTVEFTGVVFLWNGYPLFPCVDENGISDVRNMKVIGNIYENSDWLEDIR